MSYIIYIIMHVHKVHRFPKTSQIAHFTRLESYVLRAFSFCTSQQAATIALKEGIEIDLIIGLRSTCLLQRTELDIAKSVWHSCSWKNLMTYKVPKRYLAPSCKIFPNENPEQNQIGFTFFSEFHKYRITWLSNRWKKQGWLCCRFVRLRWSTTSLTFQPTIAVQVCWKILRQMEECLGTLSEFVPQKSHWLAISTPSASVCLLPASRLETFKQCWMVKSKPMTEKVENFRRISHGLKWLWPEGTRTLLVEHLNFWLLMSALWILTRSSQLPRSSPLPERRISPPRSPPMFGALLIESGMNSRPPSAWTLSSRPFTSTFSRRQTNRSTAVPALLVALAPACEHAIQSAADLPPWKYSNIHVSSLDLNGHDRPAVEVTLHASCRKRSCAFGNSSNTARSPWGLSLSHT